MSDALEATCYHCGGRISYGAGQWTHCWLSTNPPQPDPRVPPHEAWPYTHSHQVWAPVRRARDGKLPSALGPVLLGVYARLGAE